MGESAVLPEPRVLLVEDDDLIRLSVDAALRREGYQVRAERDGTALHQAVDAFLPDIAVLDVRLPQGPDGYQMAATLRRRSSLPILLLTAADAIADRLAGFTAGADDYLAKPFAMAELLARVRALLHRSGRLASTSRQIGDLAIDEVHRTAVHGGRPVELTRTEFDLLSALALHVGEVMSKTQLLAAVWGFDAYDTNLVEVHVSALRRKLEEHGPRLVQTVRGAGYVLRA